MANTFDFHPYYLKEYRNRWFVLGRKKKDSDIMNLALDRIIDIKPCEAKYVSREDFNLADFLNNVVGVTVNKNGNAEKVIFLADNQTAPYISTKPVHHSQQVIEVLPHGVVFSIRVQLNFELERELLGFGDRIKVIAPERLKKSMKRIFEQALDSYNYEFSYAVLANNLQKFLHKGSAILHHVYSKKEINVIKQKLHQYFIQSGLTENTHAIRNLLTEIPELKELVLNANLRYILKKLDGKAFLTKAIYFDKTPESNWYVTWHQDIVINVKERIETDGFSGWTKKLDVHGVVAPDEVLKQTITVRIHLDDADETNGALNIIPGSQNKRLSDSEIALITQSVEPYTCNVSTCGVHLMRPLLLHASSKATSQKHRRVIHLEFSSVELPNGLEWAERDNIL